MALVFYLVLILIIGYLITKKLKKKNTYQVRGDNIQESSFYSNFSNDQFVDSRVNYNDHSDDEPISDSTDSASDTSSSADSSDTN